MINKDKINSKFSEDRVQKLNRNQENSKKNPRIFSRVCVFLMIFSLNFGLLQGAIAAPPPGSTTAPYQMTYTARLRTAGGAAITTPHSVRFSLWTDADVTPGIDVDAGGNIDVLAPGYAGWQETHTVTPNVDGIYTVQLGSLTTLPNFTSSVHLFLQVEVKAAIAPLTSFEVLDPDGNIANTTDRKPFNSVPYAINADTVDNRDVGFGPGEIPYLNAGSKLDFSLLPGGVNSTSWIIDNNNVIETAGTGTIKLQFGGTLNKILEYDLDNSYFNFNDNVNIAGTLTVGGAPIGPSNRTIIYEPFFADAVISQDGLDNKGKLEVAFVDSDGMPGNNNINHYLFSTRQSTLQDLDLILRVKIPDGFVSWQATPMELVFQTADGNIANNRVDVTVEDTNGNNIVLTGASSLANAAWTTSPIGFVGVPVFTAGQSITVKIKMSASNIGLVRLGKLKLSYFGT